ncbi:MAG: nitroreductase family deazaflavin-dependent oxidoreductase [Dehalococcoidia bacterium]
MATGAEPGPDSSLASEEYCYLTTVGRKTGKPHRIEIWFALRDPTVFMLSGGRNKSDWVKNLVANPAVKLELSVETIAATARSEVTPEEDAWARQALVAKYQPGYDGDLTNWGKTSLVVAHDIAPA